jgi:hypothetical protein
METTKCGRRAGLAAHIKPEEGDGKLTFKKKKI